MTKEFFIISIQIVAIVLLLYITYRSYLRQKFFSGQKFVWSKNDLKNSSLKGFHYYQNPILWAYFTISFAFDSLRFYFRDMSNIPLKFILFLAMIVYVIVSYFKERSLRQI